ncbi:MAG: hypothetical protein K0R02_850 [Rickettsiaceae bacterium]|jgi:hypothetical protein|nr:hypothetical protein [Rickettsiaceae bacterium]
MVIKNSTDQELTPQEKLEALKAEYKLKFSKYGLQNLDLEKNLFEILGVKAGTQNKSEIQKAYQSTINNPFLETDKKQLILRAYHILTNKDARAMYDAFISQEQSLNTEIAKSKAPSKEEIYKRAKERLTEEEFKLWDTDSKMDPNFARANHTEIRHITSKLYTNEELDALSMQSIDLQKESQSLDDNVKKTNVEAKARELKIKIEAEKKEILESLCTRKISTRIALNNTIVERNAINYSRYKIDPAADSKEADRLDTELRKANNKLLNAHTDIMELYKKRKGSIESLQKSIKEYNALCTSSNGLEPISSTDKLFSPQELKEVPGLIEAAYNTPDKTGTIHKTENTIPDYEKYLSEMNVEKLSELKIQAEKSMSDATKTITKVDAKIELEFSQRPQITYKIPDELMKKAQERLTKEEFDKWLDSNNNPTNARDDHDELRRIAKKLYTKEELNDLVGKEPSQTNHTVKPVESISATSTNQSNEIQQIPTNKSVNISKKPLKDDVAKGQNAQEKKAKLFKILDKIKKTVKNIIPSSKKPSAPSLVKGISKTKDKSNSLTR